MENWKKALVVVGFMATIGGLVATQYATAKVQFTLGAKTKTATLQFVAFDKAVDNTYGDYLLQNITASGRVGIYKLNFGTLAWHYNATWTAAFAIVWTGATPIRIVNCSILDNNGAAINTGSNSPFGIQVYLHANPTKPCSGVWGPTADTTKLLYYTNTTGTVDHHADGYVLEGTSLFTTTKVGYKPYGSNLYLYLVDKSSTSETVYGATWTPKPGTTTYYVWASNYTISGALEDGLPIAANIDTDATNSVGANFVWVEIAITPNSNTPASLDGYTISFAISAA